jgi:hypothetical protein
MKMREIASTSALSIIVLITSLLAHHVAGWGATGHRAVAYLAFNYLSPDTTKYLTDILENYPPYDISDAATWADQVRYSRPYTEGWHFIGTIIYSIFFSTWQIDAYEYISIYVNNEMKLNKIQQMPVTPRQIHAPYNIHKTVAARTKDVSSPPSPTRPPSLSRLTRAA